MVAGSGRVGAMSTGPGLQEPLTPLLQRAGAEVTGRSSMNGTQACDSSMRGPPENSWQSSPEDIDSVEVRTTSGRVVLRLTA